MVRAGIQFSFTAGGSPCDPSKTDVSAVRTPEAGLPHLRNTQPHAPWLTGLESAMTLGCGVWGQHHVRQHLAPPSAKSSSRLRVGRIPVDHMAGLMWTGSLRAGATCGCWRDVGADANVGAALPPAATLNCDIPATQIPAVPAPVASPAAASRQSHLPASEVPTARGAAPAPYRARPLFPHPSTRRAADFICYATCPAMRLAKNPLREKLSSPLRPLW